jgi:hypothetical protein
MKEHIPPQEKLHALIAQQAHSLPLWQPLQMQPANYVQQVPFLELVVLHAHCVHPIFIQHPMEVLLAHSALVTGQRL